MPFKIIDYDNMFILETIVHQVKHVKQHGQNNTFVTVHFTSTIGIGNNKSTDNNVTVAIHAFVHTQTRSYDGKLQRPSMTINVIGATRA